MEALWLGQASASPELAKHGHFRHAHPGSCVPCRGWGFVETMLALPPTSPGPLVLHYVRCRACDGTGGGRRIR